MVCVFPAEKPDPDVVFFPLSSVISEVAERIRYCETLKIPPAKVAGLRLLRGATFRNAKAVVTSLDAWRHDDTSWKDDPEAQRRKAS